MRGLLSLARLWVPFSILMLMGCATQKQAEKSSYDFSKIHKISVMPFEGLGGSSVTDEFVKAILSKGLEVSDNRHQGDALLKGVVNEYKANNQLTVFLGTTTLLSPNGQTTIVENPIVSSLQSPPETAAVSRRNAQLVSIVASAGVTVNLIDPSSKNVVWAGRFSYEGLELKSTTQSLAQMVINDLAKNIPAMRKSAL